MKTLKEVQAENEFATVYTSKEFAKLAKAKIFIPYDGIGYLHDGEKETSISIWNVDLNKWTKYPYICWYGR